ncbi:MAG: hypothetical protein Q8Q08_10055 [Candidatus Omnitrophota bacterium]|nr:hypothetical protein [Candidatus Omnitrophota bacterium]
MIKYLKSESYYDDLYDLWTVEECLRIEKQWANKIKDLKEGEVGMVKLGKVIQLHFAKGERYRSKRKVLDEWIEADKKRDEKLNRTDVPKDVKCLKCQGTMEVTFKDLNELDINVLRVLFFFECLKCGKRRGVFEDGQEYELKGARLSKSEMDQWDTDDIERKKQKKKDQELLEKRRADFCLSDNEGVEYILDSNRLKEFAEVLKEREQKKADPAYEEAMKLKKLTIVELEKFLKMVLEKEKYINLSFDKPIIDKHVIVPLTVQDEKSTREEYISVWTFQRILKKALNDTNWRLMSEGVNYRLGYLICKLKGYEQEADLIQIVKK